MDLNSLETKFFKEILNAELDVPVQATLRYMKNSLEMIVVPEIGSSGHFELKYYNAPEAEPQCNLDESSGLVKKWQLEEDFGRHPLLQQAWSNDHTVSLQLHTSHLPRQPKVNSSLSAKVLYAGMEHRGSLALVKNQLMVQESQLAKAKFNIVGFPDFLTPERLRDSVSGLVDSKRQALKSVAQELRGGATLKLAPAPPHIVLECDDGWKITVIKDETPTRGSVSHIGLIEKSDGAAFGADEVGNLLRALKYFFAFAACTYCQPTVVIGYDSRRRPVWGKIGRFAMDWLPPANWFNNNRLPMGAVLEQLFPKFWLKWLEHKEEIVAIIECYVHSHAMRETGIVNDAVAKSCSGLTLVSSLQKGRPVNGTRDIRKTLSEFNIPNLRTTVVSRISNRLGGRTRQGPDLLNRVRNYIAHPLEKDTPVRVKQEPLVYLDSEPMEYVYLHDLSQFYLEYMFLAYCGLEFKDHRPLLEDIQ